MLSQSSIDSSSYGHRLTQDTFTKPSRTGEDKRVVINVLAKNIFLTSCHKERMGKGEGEQPRRKSHVPALARRMGGTPLVITGGASTRSQSITTKSTQIHSSFGSHQFAIARFPRSLS